MSASTREIMPKNEKNVEMSNVISESSSSLTPVYVTKEKIKDTKETKLHSEIKEQQLKVAPEGAALDAVITKSTLVDRDSAKQAEKIKAKFNEDRPLGSDGKPLSCFSTSSARGTYIDRDQFILGHRNKVPELASFNQDYNTTMVVKVDGTQVEQIGIYKHYDLFFGVHGCYVLNVPQDKFAKAMSGNQPKLYGPGPHVIKDPNFSFNPQTGLVNQSESVISHGNLHVIRVPKGSVAKIWLGTEPYILDYREEPYVFNSPLFRIERNAQSVFFNVNETVISHGTITILRIPAGSYAKVWNGTKPVLLFSRDEPYYFDSAQFRLERNGEAPFWEASKQIIQHGTINIIRVPSGSIAKVWEGSTPKLLESRDEPYVFDSPQFSIDKNGNRYFYSATEKLIEHGSIKRILPPINEVAVVSEGGKTRIIGPTKDGSPTIIESSSYSVAGFVNTTVQTVTFPSEETKAKRLSEDKNATKESLIYEVFTTKDSLQVAVKLLVAYQILDPALVVEKLGINGVVGHIENLANADMGRAIQQCSSQEVLTSYQTKPHREGGPGAYGVNSAPPPQHYQDVVRQQLAKDLKELGIELNRLNIENLFITNREIAAKMEQQSIKAAEKNAEEAILRQTYNIELGKAEREAAIKKVAQDQENQSRLSAAQAKLDAAKMEADAKLVTAKAEADAIVLKADAEAKAISAKTKAEGQALADHPALLELRMLTMKMEAVQNIKFFPPTAGTLPPGMAVNPYALFSQFTSGDSTVAVEQKSPAAAPSLSHKKE